MDIALRLLVAAVVGGAIDAEREYRDKAAGFRTILLITLAPHSSPTSRRPVPPTLIAR